MTTGDQSDDFEQLHALITNSEDIKGFLDQMAGFPATALARSAGAPISAP
jgi:hypothetical protein